jgi:hypothetical protein
MSSCENTIVLDKNLIGKNEIFQNIFNIIFNTKIPNIFRQCYSESREILFPTSFPVIYDDINNLSTYNFHSPKIISNDNIKSIFFYGIQNDQNISNKKLKSLNIKLINNNLKILFTTNNLNNFKYYIINKYSPNSLFMQYFELISIIYENYEYNINNKITCTYNIYWDYTFGCTLSGYVVKNYNNNWNSNQLLILHYFITTMTNQGLDSFEISSTNLTDFLNIFRNFFFVLRDVFREFHYKYYNLNYCAPKYFFNFDEIKNLYKIYYKNSEINTTTKLNNNYISLNIYCYNINITHYLNYEDNELNNTLSLDGAYTYTDPSNNTNTINQSNMYKYFFERTNNNRNNDELKYKLEDSTNISTFPLFYYDNNINNNNNSKYVYNKEVSNYFINGNKQFYLRENININQQFVFNNNYYTSILVIIDKDKFDNISNDQDILNTTEFGKNLIGNFQTYFENGTINIKSDSNDKTFNLDEYDLIYDNNIVLCFLIKNQNLFSINSMSTTDNQLVNLSQNYIINFSQNNYNLQFINKKNLNIFNYKNNISILKLFQRYRDFDIPFDISNYILDEFSLNYQIQKFTNINQKNYNFDLGSPITYTLTIKLLDNNEYKPLYINMLYYDNYTKEALYVYDPSTLDDPEPSIWNLELTTDDDITYTINFDNNYNFPWSDILIVIVSEKI